MNGHTDAIAHGIVPDTDHDNAFDRGAAFINVDSESV